MDKKRIESEMRELEIKIHYHFNDISWHTNAISVQEQWKQRKKELL